MKLASITAEGRGETDRILSELATLLTSEGVKIVGIVKDLAHESAFDNGCDMKVRVLPDSGSIAITQSLGQGSGACRLDPAGIALAVSKVSRTNMTDADLFILNKFGPEEAEGRGFRDAIAVALDAGVPVLVGLGIGADIRTAFAAFSGGLSQTLSPDADAIRAWLGD